MWARKSSAEEIRCCVYGFAERPRLGLTPGKQNDVPTGNTPNTRRKTASKCIKTTQQDVRVCVTNQTRNKPTRMPSTKTTRPLQQIHGTRVATADGRHRAQTFKFKFMDVLQFKYMSIPTGHFSNRRFLRPVSKSAQPNGPLAPRSVFQSLSLRLYGSQIRADFRARPRTFRITLRMRQAGRRFDMIMI